MNIMNIDIMNMDIMNMDRDTDMDTDMTRTWTRTWTLNGMPDLSAYSQSGTEKLTMPELVWNWNKVTQLI
jgi:hypothetical protein